MKPIWIQFASNSSFSSNMRNRNQRVEMFIWFICRGYLYNFLLMLKIIIQEYFDSLAISSENKEESTNQMIHHLLGLNNQSAWRQDFPLGYIVHRCRKERGREMLWNRFSEALHLSLKFFWQDSYSICLTTSLSHSLFTWKYHVIEAEMHIPNSKKAVLVKCIYLVRDSG